MKQNDNKNEGIGEGHSGGSKNKSLEARLLDWFQSGETGASSKCMAAHLTGKESDGNYPHDAGDFGRCIGLLEAVPDLRPKIYKMAKVNTYWASLVVYWEELEKLSGDYEAQTAAIKKIIRPIEAKDKSVIRLGGGVTIRFGGL